MADEVLQELMVLISGSAAGVVAAFQEANAASAEHGAAIAENTGKISGALESLGIMAAAMFGVELVEKVADFAKSLVENANEVEFSIGKMAKEFGTSTEFMSALRVAGEEVDVSLETMSTSLRTMQRSIEQAAQGTGTAVVAFAELGINVDSLKDKKPEDQFKIIAQALSQVSDQSQKAALAQQLFGRAGMEMLPVLNEGADAIDKASAKAKELGVSFSELDISRVEESHKAWTEVSDVLLNIGNQILQVLLPYIKGIADYLVSAGKQGIDFGDIMKTVINGILTLIDDMRMAWHNIQISLQAVKVFAEAWYLSFNEGLEKVLEVIYYLGQKINALGEITEDVGLLIATSLQAAIAVAVNAVVQLFGKMENIFADMMTSMGEQMTKLGVKGADLFQEAGNAVRQQANAMSQGMQQSADAASKAWKNSLSSIGNDVKDLGKSWNDVVGNAQGFKNWDDNIAIMQSNLDKAKDKLHDMANEKFDDHAIRDWADSTVEQFNKVTKAAVDSANARVTANANADNAMLRDGAQYFAQYDKGINKQVVDENKAFAQRQADARAYAAKTGQSQQDLNGVLEELQLEHNDRLKNMNASAAQANLALWESGLQGQVQVTQSILQNLSVLMESKHRAMFEVGKAAAMANTIVNTAQAAMGAYNAMASIPYVGPELGALAAAAAIAAGEVQLAKIQSTHFGSASSGGSSGGSSISAGGGASSPGLTKAGTGQSAPKPIVINLQGNGMYSAQQIRDLVDQINNAQSDGTTLQGVNQVST